MTQQGPDKDQASGRAAGLGRVLLLVDAGFLLKALAYQVGKVERSEVQPDFASISDVLADVVEENTGHRPIRQIWYDAANDSRPRSEHRALASIPGVQVRLGWMAIANGRPVQKAVDSLIVRDMLRTAYRGAADTVILLSGDGDLVPGAQELVEYGIGFHLWGVALDDPRVRQSRELIEVADARLALELGDLVPFVRPKKLQEGAAPHSAIQLGGLQATIEDLTPEVTTSGNEAPGDEPESGESALAVLTPVKTGAPSLRQLSTPEDLAEDRLTDQIDDVQALEAGRRYGQRWLQRIDSATLERFLARNSRPSLPKRIDLDLISYLAARGRDIDNEVERRDARNGVWDALERRSAAAAIDDEFGEVMPESP